MTSGGCGKQAEENPITPDTVCPMCRRRTSARKQAEENPITPDTDLYARNRRAAEEGSKQKRTRSRRTPRRCRSLDAGRVSKQAEENPITPDTVVPCTLRCWLIMKQAEENPITPDTSSRVCEDRR